MEELNKYKDYLLARSLSLNYLHVMSIFLAYLGDKELSQTIITTFFNDKKYGIQTKNMFIKAGRHYQIFLGNADSEWHKIKLLKPEQRIPKYLSTEDLAIAKEQLITNESGTRLSITKINALLEFLFYSCCRKQELLTLNRSDFDLAQNRAKVMGKGRKERYVYFPSKVKKDIEIYFRDEPEEGNAFSLTEGRLNYLMYQLSKYLNRRIYPHLFRHSGARDMVNKGVPINVVSKILGHSALSTTMIYISPDEKMINDNYKKMME